MKSNGENDQFARLITSIEPWLGEVVIIGGWAHRLYRLIFTLEGKRLEIVRIEEVSKHYDD